MQRRGQLATLFLGLGLLALGLLFGWSTARFVRGAVRATGRVSYSSGPTVVVECSAPGRREYVTVRKPTLALYRAGAPIAILVNPSVTGDPLHPEYYSLFPIVARVDSPFHLWAGSIFLVVLGGSLLSLFLLSCARPVQFRVSTRFEIHPRHRNR